MPESNKESICAISGRTSNKIIMFQFIGSLLVLLIHSSADRYFDVHDGLGLELIAYINHAIPFACVSIFAFMSGFLFFKGIDGTDKKIFFKKKLKSRVRTLLIPYLLWNILALLFVIGVTAVPFLKSATSGFTLFDYTLGSVLEGIFFHKYDNNWYLFFIMKYMLFSPLIYICLKNKKAGALFLALIFAYSGIRIEGSPGVIISDNSYNILMLYCLGGYISIHKFNWINKSYSRPAVIFAAAGTLLITVVYFLFKKADNNYYVQSYIIELLRIAFVLLLWIACDAFAKKEPGQWCRCSFFIYLVHGNLLLIVSKIFSIVYNRLGLNQLLGALLNITFVLALTLVIIEIMAYILKKYFNKIWILLVGGRG